MYVYHFVGNFWVPSVCPSDWSLYSEDSSMSVEEFFLQKDETVSQFQKLGGSG